MLKVRDIVENLLVLDLGRTRLEVEKLLDLIHLERKKRVHAG